MNDTPSALAKRITKRIIEETGYTSPEQDLLELVHQNTKDLRPIHAYSQSLKQTLMRIIDGGEPELKAIAKTLGIALAD